MKNLPEYLRQVPSRDLNPRPLDRKSDTLPTAPRHHSTPHGHLSVYRRWTMRASHSEQPIVCFHTIHPSTQCCLHTSKTLKIPHFVSDSLKFWLNKCLFMCQNWCWTQFTHSRNCSAIIVKKVKHFKINPFIPFS